MGALQNVSYDDDDDDDDDISYLTAATGTSLTPAMAARRPEWFGHIVGANEWA